MRKLKYLLLLVHLLLTACIPELLIPVTSDARIQGWIEQEFYGNALAALNAKPRSNRDEALIKKVSLLAQQYDQKQASKIRSLYQSGLWSDALTQLNNALEHYPEGTQLNLVSKQLRKAQAEYIGRLRAQLLLAKAQWLLQARRLQNNMQSVDPYNNRTADIEKTAWDIITTADELYELGIKAMHQRDIDLAYNCLRLSDKLHSSGKTTTAIAQLDQIQFAEKQRRLQEEKQAKQKEIQKQQEETHRQFQSLSKQLTDALANGDLVKADKILYQMKQLNEKPHRLKELQVALDKAIQAHVNMHLLRGNQLYKNGQIAQARDTWLKALKLQPDNKQLKQNIARAEKVLKRLQELKSKKPVIKPAEKK